MKGRTRHRVPAVVVGDGLNGLGVLRSLGRAGVPTFLVGSDRMQPAMRSRYGQKVLCSSTDPNRIITALENLAGLRSDAKPVLFLTQEDVVEAVSERRNRLRPLYRFTLPEPRAFEALFHKDGFHAAALRAKAPVPSSVHITNASQLAALADLRPPLVVKPAYRHAGYAVAFKKAYRVDHVAEARTLVERILPVLPDVVIQEWIEGQDSDIYFCLQYRSRAGPCVSFAGRKLRSWPPGVGGTASCTAAPEAAQELEHLTSSFFRAAGVVGMAGLEFKRDTRSGQFMMVEPTLGRTDYQAEVATLNGINIPYAAYLLELGKGVPGFRQSVHPIVWRDSRADRQSAAMPGQTVDLNGARVVDALWRWDDPGPKLAELQTRIRTRVIRHLGGGRRSGKART